MKMLAMNEFEIETIRPRLLYFTRCNISNITRQKYLF